MSATLGIGGGIGLVVGGLMVDHASYHWIFWLGAAMAVMAAAAALIFVPESPNRVPAKGYYRAQPCWRSGFRSRCMRSRRPTTGAGPARRRSDWDPRQFVVITFWVWLEKRTREPLADVSLLAEPRSR